MSFEMSPLRHWSWIALGYRYESRHSQRPGGQNYHLVMTHIAMENPHTKWWFIAGKIIYRRVMFHGYVK